MVSKVECFFKNYISGDLKDYRHGFLLVSGERIPGRKNLILVPGFLSEIANLAEDNVSKDKDCIVVGTDVMIKSDWYKNAKALSLQYDLNVYVLNWPANKVLKSLLLSFKNVFLPGLGEALFKNGRDYANLSLMKHLILRTPKFLCKSFAPGIGLVSTSMDIFAGNRVIDVLRSSWLSAVKEADDMSSILYDFLMDTEDETLVVGHSLGGRIVLKSHQRFKTNNFLEKSRHKFMAMAPAVSLNELEKKQDQLVPECIEVYYSRKDYVLLFMYRLGQMSLRSAVGRKGFPKKHILHKSCINVSRAFDNNSVGHSDYSKEIFKFIYNSDLFLSFSAGTKKEFGGFVEEAACSYTLNFE